MHFETLTAARSIVEVLSSAGVLPAGAKKNEKITKTVMNHPITSPAVSNLHSHPPRSSFSPPHQSKVVDCSAHSLVETPASPISAEMETELTLKLLELEVKMLADASAELEDIKIEVVEFSEQWAEW